MPCTYRRIVDIYSVVGSATSWRGYIRYKAWEADGAGVDAEALLVVIAEELARVEAEQAMNRARTRYTWAKNNKAEEKYPEAFKTATEALQAGNTAFGNKDFDVAVVCAKKVLDALAVVTGDESSFATLPAQYRIRTWRGERDCLWNIAKDKAIYDNPYLWRKLYEANKNKLPDPNNPDWVEPGIILTIPSLRGEKRDGMYDPAVTYEKLPSGKK